MCENRDTLNNVIILEWDMFRSVNKGKARAECQENYEMFFAMRQAQFSAWSAEALESYLEDLNSAAHTGRNLLAEKYIHMMKTTDPSRYQVLIETIVRPNERIQTLATEISNKILEQAKPFFDAYPCVTGSGRPLDQAMDSSDVTSVETYQLSELFTYSEKTLLALKNHILGMEESGVLFAQAVLENTVKVYGYHSLYDAEAAAKKLRDQTDSQMFPNDRDEARAAYERFL